MSGQVPEATAHRRLLRRGLAVTGVAFAGSVLFGVGSAAADDAGELPADDGRDGHATLAEGTASLSGGLLDLGDSLLDSDASLLGLDTLAGIGEVLDAEVTGGDVGSPEVVDADVDSITLDEPGSGPAVVDSAGSDSSSADSTGTADGPRPDAESDGEARDGSGDAAESEPGLTAIVDAVVDDTAADGGADLATEFADAVAEPGRATAGRLLTAGSELGGALRGTVGAVAPVVEVVGTVTDTALAPAISVVEPVVATVDPILAPILAPVVATVEPVVSSVITVAAPLADGLAPVTATVAPVVTAVRPVADLVSVTDSVAPVVGMLDDIADDAEMARLVPGALQVPVPAHPTVEQVDHESAADGGHPTAPAPAAGVESDLSGSTTAAPSNPSVASGDLMVSAEFAGGERPNPLPALAGLPGLSMGALSAAAAADQPAPSSSALLPEEAVQSARFVSAAAHAKSVDGQAQREANRPSVSPD